MRMPKPITQEYIDSLPVIDGVALWQEEDEPGFVVDAQGIKWMLGSYKGVMYKQRMLSQ